MNAIITGASRGIGKAIARIYAQHGYDLLLCSQNEYRLLETIEELKKDFPQINIQGQAFDLGTREGTRLLGEWVLSQTDTVDILVNNAGTFVPGNVSDEPEGALEKTLQVNLFSAYHLTRHLLPRMKEQQSGHIFSICSVASIKAYPNGGAYSISKYALLGFTTNLREELKTHGIKVTAVLPGAAYTDSWKQSGLPEDRFMKAEDIASLIYTASQLSPGAVVEEILVRPQLGDI
jgi:short-subunit dehydrogenase